MSRVKKYENSVLFVLRRYEPARSDDKYLYFCVLREEHFNTGVSLEHFLLSDSYPNYDSITRIRRKLQEKYPELRPPKNEQKRREEAEEDFRAYARGEE